MKVINDKVLSFDDVILEPQYSNLKTRKKIDKATIKIFLII